jgi:hypothetical protein
MRRNLRIVALLGLIGGAAMLAVPSVHADATPADAGEDFAMICPAALFRPDQFELRLVERGFERLQEAPLSKTWETAVYYKTQGNTYLHVNRKSFSDLKTQSCIMTAQIPLRKDDIAKLKIRLEADPDVGGLEGEVFGIDNNAVPQTAVGVAAASTGYFKRAGTASISTLTIMGTQRISTFTFALSQPLK